jgi:hypothetical protein
MRYIVGQVEGVEQPVRLGEFATEEEAQEFLAGLPGVEDGIYYLDEVEDAGVSELEVK